jgi:hypothetical protein
MRKIPGFISFVGISFTMCGCGQDAPISPIKHTKEQAKSTKVYSASQFPRMQRDKSFLDYEIIHKSGKSVIPWAVAMESKFGEPNTDPVSYTHLTLPTN